MREIYGRGYLLNKNEWCEQNLGWYYGGILHQTDFYGERVDRWFIIDGTDTQDYDIGPEYEVVPESVGQYTGMNEFVVTDRTFNKPLFEGDIVEVWSRRRPTTENIELFRDKPTSQYDVEVKARAVICFKYGRWFLDYDNEYNKALCKLRGNEQTERTVNTSSELDHFQYRGNNEEWYREHNHRFKWHDIVKIGTVFENADLLEG